MKLLFDTHAFIWWDYRSTQLSLRAWTACASPANRIHLSVASVWELQIKLQLGRLTLRLPLEDVLTDQKRNGLIIEPISVDDVLGLGTLPMIHRDPFDRISVAQARRGDFHLLSHDPEVARYNVRILW